MWRNHKKVRDKNRLETRNNEELRRSKESEGRKRGVIKRKQRGIEKRRVIALDGGEAGGTSKAINAWWSQPLGPPDCSQTALPPQLQAACV